MIFGLDVRRARKGDCLLLHYGTRGDPGLALIDGGPADVYGPQLKPRLAAIRAARGLQAADTLPLDLLLVSHIDDDHIRGILELTDELIVARDARRPLPLKIRDVWHNSFDDVIGSSPNELHAAVAATYGAAALAGELDVEGLEPAAGRVLASIPQGVRLRDDIRGLKLRLNRQFDGHPVVAADNTRFDMGKGLSLAVAGPMQDELAALHKAHEAWFKKQEGERNTKAALAAFTDTSVPNLSSLVVLAEVGGRRMLLTGDARGDKILLGLERVGALAPGGQLHVDVLKAPHHGSDRDVAPVFFERITADHYVFSGDGEHGNPERATLEMLFRARGDAAYTVHVTYPIDEIDQGRKKDWEKEQQKEISRKRRQPDVEVRPDWSPATHSVTAFLAAHADFAGKIRVVEPGVPHVIDTLEPLGF